MHMVPAGVELIYIARAAGPRFTGLMKVAAGKAKDSEGAATRPAEGEENARQSQARIMELTSGKRKS